MNHKAKDLEIQDAAFPIDGNRIVTTEGRVVTKAAFPGQGGKVIVNRQTGEAIVLPRNAKNPVLPYGQINQSKKPGEGNSKGGLGRGGNSRRGFFVRRKPSTETLNVEWKSFVFASDAPLIGVEWGQMDWTCFNFQQLGPMYIESLGDGICCTAQKN